ncbi:MAG: hypothetical protein ACR2OO_11865, partial [Thermomicrobiales bacterium]
MFCTACASLNPATMPRCRVCGAALGGASTEGVGSGRVGRGIPGSRRGFRVGGRRLEVARTLAMLPLLLALLLAAMGVRGYRGDRAIRAAAYDGAAAALSVGDFTSAISLFAAAGGLDDAEARRAAAIAESAPYRERYLRGTASLDAGRYDDAIADLSAVVRDIPGYERASSLLATARGQRATALTQAEQRAESRHDWLAAEQAQRRLAADDPDNAPLARHLAEIERLHAPMVFTRDGALYLIGPDMLDERLVSDELKALLPNWNPERTKLAFYSPMTTGIGAYGFYTIDPDGTALALVADHVQMEGWPHWSPDGTRLAYSRQVGFDVNGRRGITSIRVVDLATRAEVDLTDKAFPLVGSPSWSPDGKRLAFISKNIYAENAAIGRRQTGEVHVVEIATGAMVDVTGKRVPYADYVAWSPTAERMLIFSNELGSAWAETSRTTIHLLDLRDGRLDEVSSRAQSVSYPVWSPDGARYAFLEGVKVVQVHGVDVSRTWVSTPRAAAPYLTWAPDGTAIVIPANTANGAAMLIP